jgi:cytochrome b involved in lipid metabolism
MDMTLHATSGARRSVTGALATMALAATMIGGGALVAPAASASAVPQSAAGSATAGRGALVSTRSYSKATVAKHNKASDCWTIVDGNVYNLTKFVAKHPGGRKRIIRMCGRDASAAFRGQHSRGSRASTVVLKRYKIGTLR